MDWDYFSGCLEHVFDAPIWGTRDTHFDRLEAWQARAAKRNGKLSQDFPLLENWQCLKQLVGTPSYATVSHEAAYGLLGRLHCSSVLNLDSHHDLYSQSGDPARVRAGNWAGLALEHGLITHYTCVYPPWHASVRVTEGFDLKRTRAELGGRFETVQLERCAVDSLELHGITAVLLVQSPAWTSPEHDWALLEVVQALQAQMLEPLLNRA